METWLISPILWLHCQREVKDYFSEDVGPLPKRLGTNAVIQSVIFSSRLWQAATVCCFILSVLLWFLHAYEGTHLQKEISYVRWFNVYFFIIRKLHRYVDDLCEALVHWHQITGGQLEEHRFTARTRPERPHVIGSHFPALYTDRNPLPICRKFK